jgi:hypothetical protein
MAGALSLEQFDRSSINMLFGGISHRLDAERHLEISKVALASLHYTRSYVHMSWDTWWIVRAGMDLKERLRKAGK